MKKLLYIICFTCISVNIFAQTAIKKDELESDATKAFADIIDIGDEAITTLTPFSFYKHTRAYSFDQFQVRTSVEANTTKTEAYFSDYATNDMILNLCLNKQSDSTKGGLVEGSNAKKYFNAISYVVSMGKLNPKLNIKFKNYFLLMINNGSHTITTMVFHNMDMENEESSNEVYTKASVLLFKNPNKELYNAINALDIDKVKFWIDKGANPNATDDLGQPLLVFCVPGDDKINPKLYEILEYMLLNGADPNNTGTFGTPAIIPAVSHNDMKSVLLLLKYGADIEITTNEGKTPLDYAISNEKPEMEAFIKKEIAKNPTITPKIKENSKLNYKVDFFGEIYNFNIEVFQIDPQITFEWKMTLAGRDDKGGTITINEEALNTGYKLYNLFENGELVLDDVTTCVWVSKRVFRDIKTEDMINNLQTGEDPSSDQIFKYVRNEKIKLANGKKVNTQLWIGEDETSKIWVLDDVNNRLIMKMELGWSIIIDSIQE